MHRNLSPKRKELLEVLAGMLDGSVHLVEGIRKIDSLRYEVGEPDHKVFHPICAANSETLHFPLGEVRDRYAPAALRRADGEMNQYISDARSEILTACKAIARTFG